MTFTSPNWELTAFNGPHCGAFSQQKWFSLRARRANAPPGEQDLVRNALAGASRVQSFSNLELVGAFSAEVSCEVYPLNASECTNCSSLLLWKVNSPIYPAVGGAPRPNPDMPADVKLDYEEAAAILAVSPRGAAALLRLALQKLCKELGEPGQNIHTDLTSLYKKGLSSDLSRAMHTVRIVGNEAVHPGVLDLRDDRPTAIGLFALLNIIVQRMISETKEIGDLYALLPEEKTKGLPNFDAE